MVNTKDSPDSKTKKSTFCGNLMQSFDTHRYRYKCRESGKGDDLCTVRKIVFCVLLFLKIRNENSESSSMVAYLNNHGGTLSQEMCALIWRIMAGTNARETQIRAKHIPGNLNVLADSLSRKDKVIQTEWALNHLVFNQICHCWHQSMVDLFATNLNQKLPMYVSPVPDSQAWEQMH